MEWIKKKTVLSVMVAYLCLFITACGAQNEEVQKTEEILKKQIEAETGMVRISGSLEKWEYKKQYIIQSCEELDLFLKCMEKEELNENHDFAQIDFSEKTLLITLYESDEYTEYACESVWLSGEELKLSYYDNREQGGFCVCTLYFPYAIVSNSELTANSYEGWVKPSEVFGE